LHFHSIRPSLFGNTSCPIRARYPAYIPGVLHQGAKNQWLAYQAEKRAKGEDPGWLGELLVANDVCKDYQRDLGMQVQNWLRGVNCAA
jgi:hypothetical protein